jgi:hypothetical protein
MALVIGPLKSRVVCQNKHLVIHQCARRVELFQPFGNISPNVTRQTLEPVRQVLASLTFDDFCLHTCDQTADS